jgi:hypothetical protein
MYTTVIRDHIGLFVHSFVCEDLFLLYSQMGPLVQLLKPDMQFNDC